MQVPVTRELTADKTRKFKKINTALSPIFQGSRINII